MNDASDLRLSCADLSIRVPGRVLVENLALELEPGEILAVLGRNGAGKSLTLHTLAGLRSPDSGMVCLGGLPLDKAGRAGVARHLALLPQYTEDIFPTTVLDTVMIGRHPHIGR
ncbi:MAG: ATP-binding cassette domain-containing protein, partial [Woeseiaceae bacterium]